MSFDLLLDDSGDLEFTNNDFVAVSTIEDSFKQRIGLRLRTNRGEWKFDTTYGVPYTNEIVGQQIPKREVDAILQAETLREEGVDLISNFVSDINFFTRSYSAAFDLTTPTGQLAVTIPSQIVDPYTYPVGVEKDLTISCDLLDLVVQSNELYELLNNELPFSGASTWYEVSQSIVNYTTVYEVVNFGIPDGGTTPWTQIP